MRYAGPLLLWISVALAASLFHGQTTLPAGYVCQQQTTRVAVCRSHTGPDMLDIAGTIRPYTQQALQEATQ